MKQTGESHSKGERLDCAAKEPQRIGEFVSFQRSCAQAPGRCRLLVPVPPRGKRAHTHHNVIGKGRKSLAWLGVEQLLPVKPVHSQSLNPSQPPGTWAVVTDLLSQKLPNLPKVCQEKGLPSAPREWMLQPQTCKQQGTQKNPGEPRAR